MATEEKRNEQLQELSNSNFEIPEYQPDIKTWEIFDVNGDYVGDVKDLIFDRESLKVRYIITDIESWSDPSENRQVLIPIGLASLQEKDQEVILTEAVSANIRFLPDYEKGHITPAQEVEIREVLTGNLAGSTSDLAYENHPANFYEHDHFNDQCYRLYRTGKDGLEKGEIM